MIMTLLARTIRWLLLSMAWVLATPSPVIAETISPTISYQVTEADQTRAGDLDESAFSPYRNGQNLGFTENAVWLRVELPEVPPGSTLLIRPVHIDRIEVFSETGTRILLAGDTVTSPATYAPTGYSLELDQTHASTPLYIKLQSRNVMQPIVTVEGQSQLLHTSSRLMVAFAISLAISLFYLAWAISSLIIHPSSLIILFVLRLALFIATISIHSGVLRYLLSIDDLPPQDFAHNCSALVYISVAQLFDYKLLAARSKTKLVRLFLGLVIVAAAAKLILFFTGQVAASLQVNNLSVLGSLVWGVTASIALWRWPSTRQSHGLALSPPALLAYFTLQLIPIIALFASAGSGSEHYGPVTDFAFLNYAIIPGGFIVFALARQQRRIAKENFTISQKNIEVTAQRDAEERFRTEIMQLLNTLTHEIKTPLATLKMADATGQLDTGQMNRAIGSIETTLSQVERVERLEAGGTIADISSLEICSLLRSAANNAGGMRISCPPELPSALADPALLNIVIKNLLENAVNYTDQPDSIEISAKAKSHTIEIVISNRVTRPLRAPERLGEKYFRDATGLGKPGSGLGLYIAKSFAQKMGGALDLNVNGAVFTAKLTLQRP